MQCQDIENVLSEVTKLIPPPAGSAHIAVFYGARVRVAGASPSIVVGFEDSDLEQYSPAQIAANIVSQMQKVS